MRMHCVLCCLATLAREAKPVLVAPLTEDGKVRNYIGVSEKLVKAEAKQARPAVPRRLPIAKGTTTHAGAQLRRLAKHGNVRSLQVGAALRRAASATRDPHAWRLQVGPGARGEVVEGKHKGVYAVVVKIARAESGGADGGAAMMAEIMLANGERLTERQPRTDPQAPQAPASP